MEIQTIDKQPDDNRPWKEFESSFDYSKMSFKEEGNTIIYTIPDKEGNVVFEMKSLVQNLAHYPNGIKLNTIKCDKRFIESNDINDEIAAVEFKITGLNDSFITDKNGDFINNPDGSYKFHYKYDYIWTDNTDSEYINQFYKKIHFFGEDKDKNFYICYWNKNWFPREDY